MYNHLFLVNNSVALRSDITDIYEIMRAAGTKIYW